MTLPLAPRPAGSADRAAASIRPLLPGLGVAAAGTAVAFGLNSLLPAVSALTIAIVTGVLTGPRLPTATRDGLTWATTKFLRLGVVLLGLQLGLSQVLGLGPGLVAVIVAVVLLVFTGTLLLARLLGVPRGLGLMVATGFSICGASAIAAMDSVCNARREEVATAVTLVTLYGSAAIALIPLTGEWLGMPPVHLGRWAGLSVHEVAQVVAAASPAGAAAVGIAVLVKLTRVVMLAPMVAGMSVLERRRGLANTTGRRPPLVPLFVLGFLATMVLRTTGIVPGLLLGAGQVLTTLLFAAALFGLGTAVRIGELLRTGRRGLALGALSTLLVAGLAYGGVAVVGTK